MVASALIDRKPDYEKQKAKTRGTGYGIGDRFPEGNLGFGCRMEERSTRRAKREHDIAKPYYSPKVAAMKITIPKKSK
jgi:hypothetical protein